MRFKFSMIFTTPLFLPICRYYHEIVFIYYVNVNRYHARVILRLSYYYTFSFSIIVTYLVLLEVRRWFGVYYKTGELLTSWINICGEPFVFVIFTLRGQIISYLFISSGTFFHISTRQCFTNCVHISHSMGPFPTLTFNISPADNTQSRLFLLSISFTGLIYHKMNYYSNSSDSSCHLRLNPIHVLSPLLQNFHLVILSAQVFIYQMNVY